MVGVDWARVRRSIEQLFQERHIYIRSNGEIRGLVLSPRRQIALSCVLGLIALWMALGTGSMVTGFVATGPAEKAAVLAKAHYEQLAAENHAKLNAALAQIKATNVAVGQLVATTEKRNAALTTLLTQAKFEPGLAHALAPQSIKVAATRSPVAAVRAVRDDQDRLIAEAETYGKARAQRLRTVLHMTGINPAAFVRPCDQDLADSRAGTKQTLKLAKALDVDQDFAVRLERAEYALSSSNALGAAALQLPLARPTDNTWESSGFGARSDPFTGKRDFHPGEDFAGAFATPIHSTGPGVVSFAGVRSGYGQTVEIDHGHGLVTRYAHLSAIGVTVGQRVTVGDRIGAMGSTGRSTGPHLHYEVRLDGHPVDPARFLEAGDYVQQTG